MAISTDIATSFDQRVFVVEETTPGTLVQPSTANSATTSVMITTTPQINQQITFTDSAEIINSLNLRDQVKDKQKAGSWSFDFYIRPQGTTATSIKMPMEETLMKCLMGQKQAFPVARTISGSHTDSVTTITLSGAPGIQGPGVVLVDSSELIFFTTVTGNTLTGCVRGYAGTTPAAYVGAETVAAANSTFTQTIDRVSFSLWWKVDEIEYVASGCTVDNLAYTGAVNGYPMFTVSGQFMDLKWAGKITGGSLTTTDFTPATASDHKSFQVGTLVEAVGATDADNTGEGWTISAINTTTGVITLSGSPGGASTVLQAFLPVHTVIGSTQQSEDTQVSLGATAEVYPVSEAVTPTEISLAVSAPIQYIDNEISPTAISEYVANKRAITGSLTFILRSDKLSFYYDSENNTRRSLLIRLGDGTAGETVLIYMQRTNLQVPVVTATEPTLSLEMEYTALDSASGTEDSLVFAYV